MSESSLGAEAGCAGIRASGTATAAMQDTTKDHGFFPLREKPIPGNIFREADGKSYLINAEDALRKMRVSGSTRGCVDGLLYDMSERGFPTQEITFIDGRAYAMQDAMLETLGGGRVLLRVMYDGPVEDLKPIRISARWRTTHGSVRAKTRCFGSMVGIGDKVS